MYLVEVMIQPGQRDTGHSPVLSYSDDFAPYAAARHTSGALTLLAARSLPGRPLAALVAVTVLGVAYGLLFPERSDYLGHFLAGAGGTFLLLAVVIVNAPNHPLVVVAGVASAVLLGAAMEASIFRLAVFDPVDLANQSTGALLAGIGLLDAQRGDSSAGLAFLSGCVLLVAGFFFAFA